MTGVVTRMRAERRPAREAAMRALYQMDLSGCDPEWALSTAMEQSADLKLEGGATAYASELVKGVASNRGAVDRAIERSPRLGDEPDVAHRPNTRGCSTR